MNRRGWARRLGGRVSESVKIGFWVVLTLPVILVTAPFYLPWSAWQEGRRRCPLCGQRGTLHPVQPPWMIQNEAGNIYKRRFNPNLTVLCCSACGLYLRRTDLERLEGSTPALPS